MVIDLYRDSFTDYVKKHQVNDDRILEVKRGIANAITAARISGTPTDSLEKLKSDVDYLSTIYEYPSYATSNTTVL